MKSLENMIFIINPDRTNPFDVFDLLIIKWATCCENLRNVFLNYIWLCLCLFTLTWFAQNFATQDIHDNILGTSLGFSGLSCAKGIIYLLHFNYKPRKIGWKIRNIISYEKNMKLNIPLWKYAGRYILYHVCDISYIV